MSSATSFYELKADMPKGEKYDFKQLDGKVVLVVNTASKCGYAPQFQGLESLYKKYQDKGFVVLGFPSASFNQELSGDDEVGSFCTKNYGVSFPIMAVSDVNGKDQNQVFAYLKAKKAGLLGLSRVKWNFEKFLVDQHGEVVARYATTTPPEKIEPEIQKLLK